MRMIAANPKITGAQMAEKLNITTRAVEKQIAKLRALRKIVRVGSNKGGHWEIIQP